MPAVATHLEREGRLRIARQDYLEKDILLHTLLRRIVMDSRVSGRLLFKGGTCLIKVYLGYPRFSVDLDFTWRDQDAWNTRPSKEVRDLSRSARHAVRDAILDAVIGLKLKPKNPVWSHNSEKLTIEAEYSGINPGNQLVRFQVNFCDPVFFPPLTRDAHSLLAGDLPPGLLLLDNEVTRDYSGPVSCSVFDPREIVAEKGRAILTRRVPKGRDILDLFLIERELDVRLANHVEDVRRKTLYAIQREGKYEEQLDARDDRLAALATMDIQELLLKPIDGKAFEAYRSSTIDALSKLGNEIAGAR